MERKRQSGVTLLELLVAITIVSLLATTALFAWRAGVSGWEKASTQLEHDRAILAAHELVTEQIASMTPYRTLIVQGGIEQGGPVTFFQGEAETARFVSRYSLTHRAASGLYLVEYHVEEQEDGSRQLIFQEEPVLGYEEPGAWIAGQDTETGVLRTQFHPFERGAAAVALFEGLRECRFEYYRAAGPGRPGAWMSEWTGGNDEIPAAMRIHAVGREESGDLEPVTITAAVRNYERRRGRN